MAAVIKVENLSKIYRLGEIGTGTISRDIERFIKTKILKQDHPFLKIGETNYRASKGSSDIVYSLKDINFEIEQGDAVGIIGRNGAGKSTLLKILSRVTSPTTGKINIKGRVASLLEVGTGFHPELTGRENIYLNGAILGMRKREIDRKLDEIIDFSGVERYIDTPVKRYSSGMYMRLAFAVAAHLESEILIVDEVLAVGDAEFQKKCLGKMGEISKGEGRTVLFVSHNMSAVINLCKRTIILNKGALNSFTDTRISIQNYISNTQVSNSYHNKSKDNQKPYFSVVKCTHTCDFNEQTLFLEFECSFSGRWKPAFVAFDIKNSLFTPVLQALPISSPFIYFNSNKLNYICKIDLTGLNPDKYYISPWLGPHFSETYDFPQEVLSFEIFSSNTEAMTFGINHEHGFYKPKSIITDLNKL